MSVNPLIRETHESMKIFRRLVDVTTIQARLIKIGLIVTGTATLLIGVLLIVGVFYQQRGRMLDDLKIQAAITGENSTAALSFKDKQGAADILAALKASPSIQGAAIYDADNRLFATFQPKPWDLFPAALPQLPEGSRIGYAQLEVLLPIDMEGSRIGAIYLRSSLSGFYAYLARYALLSLLAAVLSLLVATYLLTRLQRSVTAPLHTLSVLVEHVSLLRDYAVRAKVTGQGEVARLADGINTMLNRIQRRDQDLEVEIGERKQVEENIRKLNETLEERVRVRSIELETERNFISSVLEMTSALVLVLERDGKIVTANRAAQEACGLTQKELTGCSMWQLFSAPEETMYVRELFTSTSVGSPPKNFEGMWIAAGAKRTRISWHFSLVPRNSASSGGLDSESGSDSGPSNYNLIATGNDITNQKLVEETLQHAKQVAEEASSAKSEFLANMSHEIRTPMNAIMGMTHLALQTDLSEKQRNYLEKVDSAAKGLLGIINDILDFSKIEAGKILFEHVHFYLEDLMDNLADLSMMKAREKGLELLFDIGADVPAEMVGDPLRLGQVLINLVNNAIKFTEKGEVIVAIRRFDAEGTWPEKIQLRFSITDTGIGLTEQQQSSLFNAFSQADSTTTRRYGGTGLGLSISKNLVELMHGEIGVESTVGVGSTFFFTARFDIQPGFSDGRAIPADLPGTRVLVVDNNSSAAGLVHTMLETLGFAATVALDAAQALRELEHSQQQAQAFGMVLVDGHVVECEGVEVIRRIRNHGRPKKMPTCIMVTAYDRDELLQVIEDAEVAIDGVLLKPVSPSKLLDGMLRVFGKDVGQRSGQLEVGSQEAKKSLRGATVLLVEDNEMNREVAIDILSAAGIWVDVACNGAQALEKIVQNSYDGVLMDCQMPVMGGFEATQKIRADGRFDALPVIAMTANAMSGEVEKCISSGMNDHIAKPIDVAHLFSTMSRWIKPSAEAPFSLIPTSQDASVPATNFLAPIEGLDTKTALSRMAGDAMLYRKMLVWFREGEADTVQSIRAALREDDRQTALRLAHTLKGLCGNIGADDLFGAIKKFEQALKYQQGELVRPFSGVSDVLSNTLLDEIDHRMLSLVTNIDSLFPRKIVRENEQVRSSDAAHQLNLEVLTPLLCKLFGLLVENLSEATEYIYPISTILAGGIAEAEFRRVSNPIERYDFDMALGLLREFADRFGIKLICPAQ